MNTRVFADLFCKLCVLHVAVATHIQNLAGTPSFLLFCCFARLHMLAPSAFSKLRTAFHGWKCCQHLIDEDWPSTNFRRRAAATAVHVWGVNMDNRTMTWPYGLQHPSSLVQSASPTSMLKNHAERSLEATR